MQSPVRLNKALAQAGVASRRGADELVFAGRVSVNGRTADSPGVQVDPTRDEVRVDGRKILPANRTLPRYVMMHKPVQVVTTVRDPQGRRTVMDLLPSELDRERLYPVGRLDYFSEGLLVLTNDGELANRMIHPRWHLPKAYHVRVRGRVDERLLKIMRGGMRLAEGEKLAPVAVKPLWREGDDALLELVLRQGVNRQIRRMCRDLGLTVLRLMRVRQGPLELGDLPAGASRELTPAEVAAVKKAVGMAEG